MKIKKLVFSLCALSISIFSFSQKTYHTTFDITFSGGNNGGFSGNMAADVVCTINSVDGLLDVAVNKVNAAWSVMGWYMANCWTKTAIFNQNNRYVEFRVKCNTAQTAPISINYNWNGCDGCCAQSKTWPVNTFTIPEADVWTIVFLKVPTTTGGSQNMIDTVRSWIAWELKNGNYSFDYIKLGDAAKPPIPTIDAVKTKTVNHSAGVQTVNLTGISIPNRLIDGLTISAKSLSDGILSDVTILDLGNGPFAVDEATNIATAAVQYTPVAGMSGLGDSIIITLHDTIRNTKKTTSFYVNLIGIPCFLSSPSAAGATICSGNSVTLTATGGTGYRWYDSYSGGNLLSSTASYTTPVLTGNRTYYVANYDGSCESSRVAVNVTIGSTLQPVISSLPSAKIYCNSAPIQLSATPSGGVFSGDGVELGYFVPSQAKVNHMNSIYYTYGSGSCSGKDSVHVFVFPCIDIDNEWDNSLKVYPNPATGIINIEMTDVEGLAIILVQDELGRKIVEDRQQVTRSYYGSFDISTLPTGIYVIKVIINDKSIIRKIVKQL